MKNTVDVCIPTALRRAVSRRDGGLTVYSLLVLRRVLKVHDDAALCVYDAEGRRFELGPALHN